VTDEHLVLIAGLGAGLTALGVALGAAQVVDTITDAATGVVKDPVGVVAGWIADAAKSARGLI
jgi:F0F1-type ATP synthase membrane subunit c/vacuolar-type H+-ATPase subunit K